MSEPNDVAISSSSLSDGKVTPSTQPRGSNGGALKEEGDEKVPSSTKDSPTNSKEPDERTELLTELRRDIVQQGDLLVTSTDAMPPSGKSVFVFGQNIHERVVDANITKDKNDPSSSTRPAVESASSNVLGGTGYSGSGLLFSSIVQDAKADESKTNANDTKAPAEPQKSLEQVAREYQESMAPKIQYDTVEAVTGEEGEINILDIQCKLFHFVSPDYVGLGRGNLRLNDFQNQDLGSRLLYRSSGNYRLLLNTKVWGGMVAQHVGRKSLRFTACVDGALKIFLIVGHPEEVFELFNALTERIQKYALPGDIAIDWNKNAGFTKTAEEPSSKKKCVSESGVAIPQDRVTSESEAHLPDPEQ